MQARKRNAQKKEVDLESMVQSGAHGAYEALQLYRSRAMRHKLKNELQDAVQTCTNGTVCLLENGYENAGAELATLLIDIVTEFTIPMNEEHSKMIDQIVEKFGKYPKSTHVVEFLKLTIKWGLGTPFENGLHQKLGECLWNNDDYRNAIYHFACSENPKLLNDKLFALHPFSSGDAVSVPTGENAPVDRNTLRERYLTLGIVHFLALENLRDANDLFYHYKRTITAANNGTPFTSNANSLYTFCDYLLQVCRRDAAPLFKTLVNTYASTVDFDDQVPTMLMGPIALKYFNIKPKVNPMMSMLQSMMS
jgi:hypothetical protein